MHTHDQDASETLRPRATRLEDPDRSTTARAAAEGRWDVVGAGGMAALQRASGNAGVAAALQRDASAEHEDHAGEPGGEPSPVHEVVSSGGGRPLDPQVRADMEGRLGHDFGDVRVHDDGRAHDSAVAVNAHAYTVGSNIVFQRDRYDPSSPSGQETIAHELTHVVQQRNGPVDGTATAGGIRVSDPDDRFEREAAANAERVMSVPAMGAGAPAVAGPVQREGAEVQREAVPGDGGAAAGAVQREGEADVEEEDVQGSFVTAPVQREEAGGPEEDLDDTSAG